MKLRDDKPVTRKPMDQAEWQRFKENAKEWARLSTFEARVEQLETICLRTPGAWPNRSPPDVRPEEHSDAWYAEEILFAIRAARNNLERGHASHAAAEALTIGALAADAARLNVEFRRWWKRIGSESKENALVGEVMRIVALAEQAASLYSDRRFALDMEVEFKDASGKRTAKKIYLQLKSGDSYLHRRKSDGAEIFRIRHKEHAEYWMIQECPVFLVIANSRGQIRWMEIRDYLRHKSDNGRRQVRQIVFAGERFSVESVRRWRDRLLKEGGQIRAEKRSVNPAARADR